MCGLTGFLQPSVTTTDTLRDQVMRMADTLAHRGPDDAGFWVDTPAGLAFGFRRLAIIDLSAAAHQPMLSADGRFVLVFNGAIYNFRDLRADLEKHGVRFRSTSDTEVLLEAAAFWGVESACRRLWGMFAIALWDRVDRILYLARDRLGKKPLYYADAGGVFLFASELKALRAHPAFDATISRDALAGYLRYGYVPAPYSIYQSARKLLPGHIALVRTEQPTEVRSYWDAGKVAQEGLGLRLDLNEKEAVRDLESLLLDAIGRRMISDVPLGAMLSGGIDSSVVVALMQQLSTRPVRTFTIGFSEAAYNEAVAAKAVAAHLHTEHTELYVTPEQAQEVIPDLPRYYDEPFADSSQIPTFLVCRMARKHVTVCLSGDGGDELFGGYTRYMIAQRIWNLMRRSPPAARRLTAEAIQAVPTRMWDLIYQGLAPLLPGRWRQTLPGDKAHKLAALLAAANPDGLYRSLVSVWKNPNDLVIDGREPNTILDDPDLRERFPDFTERMMFCDLVTYLPDDILVKVDRASMGVSLEARSPLLDHRVAEWAWKLPLSFKQRSGKSKWLLRQVLRRHVPPHLVERPKMGFGIPLGAWLRGSLRDWSEELLQEKRLREGGFLRPEPVRSAWADHLAGKRKADHALWAVLMFQAWSDAQRP
jgi:asparagine synthase (glutamine-hydrolysing)